MKLEGPLRHLRRHGCVLRREGKEHAIWENPQTGHAEAIPRHSEISNLLAKKICRKLSIPVPDKRH
jgi:mRNA interferase HicA